MKVILLENVRKIGSIGEIIDVKRGFARNFLISNKTDILSKSKLKFFLFLFISDFITWLNLFVSYPKKLKKEIAINNKNKINKNVEKIVFFIIFLF